MALKLRPTGLGAGIDKDRSDFTIEWAMGRIHQQRGGPAATTSSAEPRSHRVLGCWPCGLWHQKSMRRQPERLLHQ